MLDMASKSMYKVLGRLEDVSIGEEVDIPREPWPVFDTKGSKIIIGNRVAISPGVNILTHSHYFEDKNWRDMGDKIVSGLPTIIDDYAFLGINSMIMPSCKKVGKHSVIGAGSVVMENVPDCEIWAGNPAKLIKKVGE